MIALAVVCGVFAVWSGYSVAVWSAAAFGRPRAGGRWRRRGWIARPGDVSDLDGRPGIYVQWFFLGIAMYVGQSIEPDDRLRSHGKDVRALLWSFWTFMECNPEELTPVEKRLIALLPWCRWFGMNRTDGGSALKRGAA